MFGASEKPRGPLPGADGTMLADDGGKAQLFGSDSAVPSRKVVFQRERYFRANILKEIKAQEIEDVIKHLF